MKQGTAWMAAVMTLIVAGTAKAEALAGPQAAFYETLQGLCGAEFVGETTYPADPGEDWRGQQLVAEFASCSDDELRIPFHVGENRSRTWVIRKVAGGLQLKHDHRHEDGTPDEITEYGGTTAQPGTALAQSFPADAHTAALIPEATTNEWFLSLDAAGQTLTYYLERHGKPRFKAVLHRQP